MQVTVAETGPCTRSLTITVPSPLVQEHLDRMFATAQQQVQMPGFRPGRVPRAIVEKKYGAAILAEAKEQLLNRYFGEACREKDLSPVGRVAIDDIEKIVVAPGAALQFTARVDVRPQFELGNVKGLEVDAFEGAATDGDIDQALQEIAQQRRSLQTIAEPVQDGDFVKADFRFTDAAGTVVHDRKGVQLNTRKPIHGVDAAAWQQALLGTSAGKQVQVAITFPDNFEKDAVRGQQGTVHLTIHEVLRVLPPPLDDELAKGIGFDDLAALRKDLAARIGQEKTRIGRRRQEEQCLQALLQSHAVPLPPSLIEEQQRAALDSFAQRLQEQGVHEAEIAKKLEEARPEAHQEAERRVRLFFLIEAVARQQKLFVTEGDIAAELRAIAAANSTDGRTITAEQVREHLEQENRLGELRLSLLERKVRDFLRENAKIVDRKGG